MPVLSLVRTISLVALPLVANGVRLGDDDQTAPAKATQQLSAAAISSLLDGRQYQMQFGSKLSPAVETKVEQCGQLHDPTICNDVTGKCVASIDNAAPQAAPVYSTVGVPSELPVPMVPVAVPAAPAPVLAQAAPAAPVVAPALAEAAPAAPVAPEVPVPASLLQQEPAAAAPALAVAPPAVQTLTAASPVAPAAAEPFKWEPFKMVTFQKDVYVSRSAICRGHSWEFDLVQNFMQVGLQGKKGWNFLDVGANLGAWTLPAATNARNIGGKVISVEADPQTLGALSESIAMNSLLGSVETVNKAIVKDSKSQSTICLSMGDVAQEANIGGTQAALGSRNGTQECKKEVATATLDDLYASNPAMLNVGAMKLDCEGCEGQAIMGAHNFLTEKPPCFIAMEITESYLCDSATPLHDIKEFLHSHGYDTSSIAGPHGGNTCAEYKEFEKTNGIQQEFVTLGRRDAADASACMARFQDKDTKFQM